jgi:hypothetical protein
MMSNTSATLSSIKNGYNGNFHEPFVCPYLKFIHTTSHSRERQLVQTTMAFIGEQHYEQLHTDDGIINIKGQHVTKWIVTKCLR